jgi:hypothetical protein
MSTNLNNCPFCGGDAKAVNYIVEAVVRCIDCRASITRKHSPENDSGYEEAIAAWNTRTKLKVEQLFDKQIAEYVGNINPTKNWAEKHRAENAELYASRGTE